MPDIPGSVKVWQTFRDGYTASVISGNQDPVKALSTTAATVAKQVNGG